VKSPRSNKKKKSAARYPVGLVFTLLVVGVYVNVRHGAAHGKPLKLYPLEAGVISALPTLITAASIHLLVLTFEGKRRPAKVHGVIARVGVLGISAAAFRVSYDAWTTVSKAAGIRGSLSGYLPWMTEGFLAFAVYAAWVVQMQNKEEEPPEGPSAPVEPVIPDTVEEIQDEWAKEPPQAEPMPEPVIPEPEVTSPSATSFREPEYPAPTFRGAGQFMAVAQQAKDPRTRDIWARIAAEHGKPQI
jgi:hypothetical protein